MKIKHSKYRNTGLIFELLVKQIAADTLDNKDSAAVSIIKKHFVNNVQGVSRSDFENGVSVKQSLINRTKRAKGKKAKNVKSKQMQLNLTGGK